MLLCVEGTQNHPLGCTHDLLQLSLAAMLYTGAMEKGQMHGKGALVYPNSEKYEVRTPRPR